MCENFQNMALQHNVSSNIIFIPIGGSTNPFFYCDLIHPGEYIWKM